MNETIVQRNATEIYDETVKNIKYPSKSFIRFTGGEPTIYWKELIQVFSLLADNKRVGNIPILVQTNGILIGSGEVDLNELNRQPTAKLRFLFELSLKGTNDVEFEILTTKPKKLYEHQLSAYEKFKTAQKTNPNLSFVTVLGIYHSAINNQYSKYAFVYPSDGHLMFDKHKPWHHKFEKIWNESERKWVEPLRMSPKGVWENVVKRCGEDGARILKYFPNGVRTNPGFVFPAKPKGYEYARGIVNDEYW
jgi:sulfatase maturation enzyme AslB (radical SAM superfamily)